MTTVVVPTTVSELLEHELKTVVKRVVHDLGRRYEFDRKEAFDFLQDKYKMEIVPEDEERVRVKPVKKFKPKEEDLHPIMISIVEKTRCRARMYYKGVYKQCETCWNSGHTQLCSRHEHSTLRFGRVDDGTHPEKEVRVIKSFI